MGLLLGPPEGKAFREAEEELAAVDAELAELRAVIAVCDALPEGFLLRHWTPEAAARLYGLATPATVKRRENGDGA